MSVEQGRARWLVAAALGTAQTLAWASKLLSPGWAADCLGRAALGAGMALGLYDAAFATLYGRAAWGPITGITLIAGFSSTVGWPLSTVLLNAHSWRAACLAWAAMHLFVGLPLNRLVVPDASRAAGEPSPVDGAAAGGRRSMALLAFAFAATESRTGRPQPGR